MFFGFCAANQEFALPERLDKVLTSYLQTSDRIESITRSKVSANISAGHVKVNQQIIDRPSYKVGELDLIEIFIPNPEPLSLEPDSTVSLNIVFEDEFLIVLNKQAGLVVHPGAGNKSGTLVNGLLAHLDCSNLSVGENLRPGIVHRLDKDTSGLMVVAKTESAFQNLQKQFLPPRKIKRTYLALSRNIGRQLQGRTEFRIDQPIGRDPANRIKMAVRPEGKPGVTNWFLDKTYSHGVIQRLELETGRTHQIRVHLAYLGCPIVGDPLYGEKIGAFPPGLRKAVLDFGRQALHAWKLEFEHPLSGAVLEFEAPLDSKFMNLLKCFK